MDVTFHNWLAANEDRGYPFDPAATRVDNAGELVLTEWIADMMLRCDHNTTIWLGAVTITPCLISIVLVGRDGNEPTRPVAAVSVSREIWSLGAPVFFSTIDETVDGWIIPGRFQLPDQSKQHQFDSPEQSKLAERCLSRRLLNSIPAIVHARTNQRLTGLIQLHEGRNVTIGEGNWSALTNKGQVIDFGLTHEGLRACANGINAIPESPPSNRPAPILQIAGAIPDCDGNITIRFVGPFNVAEVNNNARPSGATIGINLAIDDICPDVSDDYPDPDIPTVCDSDEKT